MTSKAVLSWLGSHYRIDGVYQNSKPERANSSGKISEAVYVYYYLLRLQCQWEGLGLDVFDQLICKNLEPFARLIYDIIYTRETRASHRRALLKHPLFDDTVREKTTWPNTIYRKRRL